MLENGNWTIPETVGRVLFGLALGTQNTGDVVREAEEKGRKQALREKEVRDRDLKTGDKPPGDKSGGKKAKATLSPIEKDVQKRLDLSPSAMKHFRRIRGSSDVEIVQ